MKIRRAERDDVPAIVGLLAHDKLGRLRENPCDPAPESYYAAFEKIRSSPSDLLMVCEEETGEIVGMYQLTFIQYMNYEGGLRAQIETVHVTEGYRNKGIGTLMMHEAISMAMSKGARIVQLTTDKQRPDARRFYEKLGFRASHEGMKLYLKINQPDPEK